MSEAPPRRSLRGRLVVRARSTHDSRVPFHHDVVEGLAAPSLSLDRGPIDRVIRRHSRAALVTRGFPAQRGGRFGGAAPRWTPLEDSLGLSRTFRVWIDPDADTGSLASALRDLASVELAAPEYLTETPFAHADDPYATEDAARALVGASEALTLEPGDPSLIVAVIDSGVARAHAELRGRLRPGFDAVDLPRSLTSRDVVLLGDTSTRDRDPEDEMGHGTACASILVGRGVAMGAGLAGRARLLPMRALAAARVAGRAKVTAVGSIEDINVAVKLAVDLGARVLNLSFGTVESCLCVGDPVPHAEVVQYALAHGCVLVAASGNGGEVARYFPAALPGVIAVGAVDGVGRVARFSTRGEHVALCAPGVGVRVATLDGGYTSLSGTSFAAPFVAAAAALVRARAARKSTALGPWEVRDALMRSARPFAAGEDSSGCGAGVLDVPRALRWTDAIAARRPGGHARSEARG